MAGILGTRLACCARAASGQRAADPAITLKKSRRRIAFTKGLGLRRLSLMHYSRNLRSAEWAPTVILRSNNPQDRMSALGRYCCKSSKLLDDNFPAIRRFDRRPPICVTSVTLPRSPVSLSSGDEVPHI